MEDHFHTHTHGDPHPHGSPAYAKEPALASLELKFLKLIFNFFLNLDFLDFFKF